MVHVPCEGTPHSTRNAFFEHSWRKARWGSFFACLVAPSVRAAELGYRQANRNSQRCCRSQTLGSSTSRALVAATMAPGTVSVRKMTGAGSLRARNPSPPDSGRLVVTGSRKVQPRNTRCDRQSVVARGGVSQVARQPGPRRVHSPQGGSAAALEIEREDFQPLFKTHLPEQYSSGRFSASWVQ